jgi:hypothetical protein
MWAKFARLCSFCGVCSAAARAAGYVEHTESHVQRTEQTMHECVVWCAEEVHVVELLNGQVRCIV